MKFIDSNCERRFYLTNFIVEYKDSQKYVVPIIENRRQAALVLENWIQAPVSNIISYKNIGAAFKMPGPLLCLCFLNKYDFRNWKPILNDVKQMCSQNMQMQISNYKRFREKYYNKILMGDTLAQRWYIVS